MNASPRTASPTQGPPRSGADPRALAPEPARTTGHAPETEHRPRLASPGEAETCPASPRPIEVELEGCPWSVRRAFWPGSASEPWRNAVAQAWEIEAELRALPTTALPWPLVVPRAEMSGWAPVGAELQRAPKTAVAGGGLLAPEEDALPPDRYFELAKRVIDPDDLVGQFRRGDIPAEQLMGEEGEVLFMMIKDRLTRMQAVVEALRSISEAYNDSLKRAAEAIGR